MKRLIAIAVCALLLLSCALPALAAGRSVPAIPNQKLAFRTGPNTKYVELYTMPQSTSLQAFEYEEGNGVTWVLVEYRDSSGYVCRSYTGLKRMSVNGDIPWANHIGQTVRVDWCTVWSAPSRNARERGELGVDDTVMLLDYEGDWAFIEFFDNYNGAPSRGYILQSDIQGSGGGASYEGGSSGGGASREGRSSGGTGGRMQYVNGVVNAPIEYSDAFFSRYGADYMGIEDDIYSASGDTAGWSVGDLLATAGEYEFYVDHCNEYVNARVEADASTDSLERFYLGQSVWAIGYWHEWTLCECGNGLYGWVKSQYLEMY